MGTSTREIRAWAAQRGWEVKRGATPNSLIEAYAQAHPDEQIDWPNRGGMPKGQKAMRGQRAHVDEQPPLDGDTLSPPDSGLASPPRREETRPAHTGRPGLFGRLRAGRHGERVPRKRPAAGRQSTEKLCSAVWSFVADGMKGTRFIPLARVLEFQAPVAGVVLDQELRGTVLDPVVQPVARLVNRASRLGTLVTLPLLVQAITMQPMLYSRLREHLIDAIYDWYEIAGPEIDKKRKRRERQAENSGVDADQLITYLFAPADTDMSGPRFGVPTSDDAHAPPA